MENSARDLSRGCSSSRPDERPFVLTRASYAGGQRYAATWTGDNSATWNHLRMTVPMLLNLGLTGFAWSGADVSGFGGAPSADLQHALGRDRRLPADLPRPLGGRHAAPRAVGRRPAA